MNKIAIIFAVGLVVAASLFSWHVTSQLRQINETKAQIVELKQDIVDLKEELEAAVDIESLKDVPEVGDIEGLKDYARGLRDKESSVRDFVNERLGN